MTRHTLVLAIIALWIFQFGLAFAMPKDPRPWTEARKLSLLAAIAALALNIWLFAEVI